MSTRNICFLWRNKKKYLDTYFILRFLSHGILLYNKESEIDFASRKHAYIILTPVNPTFM